MPGSGKTEAKKILCSKGWNAISAGDIIREMCIREKIDPTRENLQRYGSNFLFEKGDTYFFNIIIEKIDFRKDNVIEGVRPIQVIKLLKENIFSTIIYIEADTSLRFERLRERDSLASIDFLRIENNSLENQIIQLKDYADHVILNNGTKKDLSIQLSNLISICGDQSNV